MTDSVPKDEVTQAKAKVASKKSPDGFVGEVSRQHLTAVTDMLCSGSSYQDQDYAEQGHIEKVNLNNNISAKCVMLPISGDC